MKLSDALFSPVREHRSRSPTPTRNNTAVVTTSMPSYGISGALSQSSAQKLSAVYAAVEIRSDDMSCLPNYVLNTKTRDRVPHPILFLLNVRPNARMTPQVRRKLLERSILFTGNAYDWIIRDPVSRAPVELIPIVGNLVQVKQTTAGCLWYYVTNPYTREVFTVPQEDICHYKGPSDDGVTGQSVLTHAATTIQAGLAAQDYNRAFYESGGQPSGILTVEGDFSGYVEGPDGTPTDKTQKDAIREEWEKIHSGAANAHKIAVLDYGMKYQALSISQKDAMFIEQQSQTVEDIARYFMMPLYKLQSGKQSYNSNEQNAIEYMGRLQPRVSQMEEEQTWKLLSLDDIHAGLEIRANMMALLRSDQKSRAEYYRIMHQEGVYNINNIRALEDMPDVEGGDEHAISLNFIPLSLWRQLSLLRNGGSSAGSSDKAMDWILSRLGLDTKISPEEVT